MVGCQSDGVAARPHDPIEAGEQFAERSIEPDQNVLDLVTVGTILVANFVERRETDSQKISEI